MRRLIAAIGLVAVASGAGLGAQQGWLALKAAAADALIDASFERSRADGLAHPPWPWADTWPVARLEVPRIGLRRTVLRGADGSSLAFAAGLLDGTGPLDGTRHAVIAGHRDGAFAFLRLLRPGDEVRLTSWSGERVLRVASSRVTSMWDGSVLDAQAEGQVTLVTCYPFDGLRSTERRYVVVLEPVVSLPARRA